ncbi:MAG: hypothetical protein QOG93_1509 [Gaiellaceae bacterium]|nr:hypothetical protein [Gaiellaceae bacterium]MDX6388843.1 hypothetical protein [Gaiellaceae bacterium]
MAGYLIAVVVFALPLAFGAAGLGRARHLLAAGGLLAGAWILVLAVGRADDGQGGKLVPLWFLAGLVALLYGIGCGGLWLGLRLRRARSD